MSCSALKRGKGCVSWLRVLDVYDYNHLYRTGLCIEIFAKGEELSSGQCDGLRIYVILIIL